MPSHGKESDSQAPRERLGRIAWFVFGVAFGVRALHLWRLADSPFLHVSMGDALAYHTWARTLADGDWLGDAVFYQAPLYPYFLGAIYALAGDHPLTLRLCQALLGAGACVLLAAAGARFFSRRVGTVAGLMLALYAPAIFFDGLVQKSVLDAFLLCAVLWCMSALSTSRRPGLALATGVAAGLLVLSRENALVFVACIGSWLVVRDRRQSARAATLAALFALGVGLALAPVGFRNRIVGGEFHLTTSQFGPNFFIGNNPGANGRYRPLIDGRGSAAFEQRDAADLAQRALGRPLTPSEVSGFWRDRAFAWIAAEPLHWLRLMGLKLAMVWNAVESIDSEDQYTVALWSTPLRIANAICHFGIVAPLALLGIWITWGRRQQLWPLYLMIAAYTASVVLFYVFARYRYPLAPLLILFASAGLVEFLRYAREQPLPRVLACVAVTTLGALLSNGLRLTSKEHMRAVTWFNLANAARVEGQLEQAADYYLQALDIAPDYRDARHNLAVTRFVAGEIDEAIALYRQNLRQNPEDLRALASLGVALQAGGRVDEAMATQRRALAIQPEFVDAHVGLAMALVEAGDPGAARFHLQRAEELTNAGEDHPQAERIRALRRKLGP